MSNLNAREVSIVVREYFDEIKKSKFIFDITSVEYGIKDDSWAISCEVTNVFDESPRVYIIEVDDQSGEILRVQGSA